MAILEIIVCILLVIGIFFLLAGVIGVIRMPDTFCRLQSATNIATMGAMPIALACSIYGFGSGNTSLGIKSLIMVVFLLISNPVGAHAMARAAYKIKAGLSEKTKFDHYGRDINE
ncbi:monovalent cation/H(+) antiporter subunit G [Clostridium sp. D53t1_180928_C8]|uniref:monovalent cation/H(+) antiporter subunit G n=1 Tax=Clostridium sp. D53t1_180928_C8 TaxID=2787101 RepID=UPI0018AA9230|nr:monovalent cation/H(+) antiporter subunit G [Clostridium sp. D53t1_180928_C8]